MCLSRATVRNEALAEPRRAERCLPLIPNFELRPNFRMTSIKMKPVNVTAAIPTTTYTYEQNEESSTSIQSFKHSWVKNMHSESKRPFP